MPTRSWPRSTCCGGPSSVPLAQHLVVAEHLVTLLDMETHTATAVVVVVVVVVVVDDDDDDDADW